jgi:cobalt-zinc-cadmium efflux system membrane fusion protein
MIVAPSPDLLAQLKLADLSSRPIVETLRVAGRIDFDEHRLARIGATITGRVTEIDAWLGQDVKKGAVLARLNSSELSEQQLAYLKARAELELNRRNAERAKALFEADVIGAAELQRRESEYKISQAETRAASDQLQLLGVSAAIERLGKQGEINSVTPVVATMSGVVVERKLAQGRSCSRPIPVRDRRPVAPVGGGAGAGTAGQPGQDRQAVSIEVPALGNEKLVGKLILSVRPSIPKRGPCWCVPNWITAMVASSRPCWPRC